MFRVAVTGGAMVRVTGDLAPSLYEELSVGATIVKLPTASLSAAIQAVEVVVSGSLSYRDDGGDPTASVGKPKFDGDSFWLGRRAAAELRMVRVGATNATARVSYYQVY